MLLVAADASFPFRRLLHQRRDFLLGERDPLGQRRMMLVVFVSPEGSSKEGKRSGERAASRESERRRPRRERRQTAAPRCRCCRRKL